MIRIIDVHKSFGQLEVLKGINMDVEQNKVHSILGASGSGKSTLLQCINGLEKIQKGKILVDEIEVNDKKTNLNSLRKKIGIVFQQFNVFPHLTTLENVTLALKTVLKKIKANIDPSMTPANIFQKLKRKIENHLRLKEVANITTTYDIPYNVLGKAQNILRKYQTDMKYEDSFVRITVSLPAFKTEHISVAMQKLGL